MHRVRGWWSPEEEARNEQEVYVVCAVWLCRDGCQEHRFARNWLTSELSWGLIMGQDIADGDRWESKSYLGLDAGLLGEYTLVGPSGRPVSGYGRL